MSHQPGSAAGNAGSLGADDDPCLLPMRRQAALIRARQVSATELMGAHLHRIAAVNPAVNAVASLYPERALAEAAAADAALARGEPCGPLHGLPAAVKDVHDVGGMRTTHGSPLYAGNVAARDELVVARIRAAGAIIVGKTNVPEFGFGAHTNNALFGPTRNPYAPTRSAGGSCGGAAAALATGMATMCEGSDMGGSLRNPASFCNVVGFRPSPGRVPDAPTAFGWQPLFVMGPMGRSVDDVALLLSVIAGPEPATPLALEADPGQFAPIRRTLPGCGSPSPQIWAVRSSSIRRSGGSWGTRRAPSHGLAASSRMPASTSTVRMRRSGLCEPGRWRTCWTARSGSIAI